MLEDNKSSGHKAVITWNEERKAFLCSVGNKTIEIVASKESKRHDDMVTPEELFVDSIAGFIKDAFLESAKRSSIKIKSYESEGQGIVGKDGEKLFFTEIKIRPRIVVVSSGQIEKAKELIKLAGENCAIANLVTCKISVCPEIESSVLEKEF